VVILNDELSLIAQEIVRANALDRVNVSLDYFDGTLNRIGAYVVGVRAAQQAFMCALLEPIATLKAAEEAGNFFRRLALLEVMKSKPFGAVYDYYCLINNVLIGEDYIAEIEKYEADVLVKR
jgi:L-rhamnose isomerase